MVDSIKIDTSYDGQSSTSRPPVATHMRRLGMRLVWQQADAAGITDPVQPVEFLLRRLYPEMPEPWFAAIFGKARGPSRAGPVAGVRAAVG